METYTGQYDQQIAQLLSQIQNYGNFSYSGQNAYKELLDKLTGYGSFDYSRQGEYDSALDKANNYGSFDYANQGAYDAALQKVINPEAFSYDLATDPQWSAYKKAYSREGDRAAANALTQAAASTGGVASSYAMNAAQQAQNYYNAQMTDIIPTLYQNAYEQYLQDYNRDVTGLSALQTERSTAYDQWLDGYSMAQNALGNLQSDRDTQYGQWQDAYNMLLSNLSAMQSDRDFEYGNWQDGYSMLNTSLGNYQNQDSTDYAKWLDGQELDYQNQQAAYAKQQDAYNNLLTLITTGYTPTAEDLAAAGMTAEQAAAWLAYYQKQNAATTYVRPTAVDNTQTVTEEESEEKSTGGTIASGSKPWSAPRSTAANGSAPTLSNGNAATTALDRAANTVKSLAGTKAGKTKTNVGKTGTATGEVANDAVVRAFMSSVPKGASDKKIATMIQNSGLNSAEKLALINYYGINLNTLN